MTTEKRLILLCIASGLVCVWVVHLYCLNGTYNVCVSEHIRKRYDKIALFLDHYTRPITVLNIGATSDWFISMLARRYAMTMVIVSRDAEEILAWFCSRTQFSNLILLKKELSLDHLERLGECEHFDVTLITDDFNALPLMRKMAISLVVDLGDYTILEVPLGGKQTGIWTRADEIRKFILDAGATIIDEESIDDAHLFIAHKPKTTLKRSYWHNTCMAADDDYIITSTFDDKYLYKKSTDTVSQWHTGINLHTFKALAGTYPSCDILHDVVQSFFDLDHNDCNPCNFIVQGRGLMPIDFHDSRRSLDQKVGYDRLMQLVAS